MKNKKIFFVLTVIFVFAISPVFSQEVAENEYMEKEFNVYLSDGIPLLHPHISYDADEAQILTALYEGLFVYDPFTLEPVGGIAEAWNVTGGRTWRFMLRKNAKFENGDKITAQTFKDSWFALLSPEENCPYASMLDFIDGAADFRTGKLKNKNQVGIKVESDEVLVVYTASPAEHLPSVLCHHAFGAVHPSQLKISQQALKRDEIKNAKKAFKPISSGAYKIEKFTEENLILVKNEKYWDHSFLSIPKINIFLKLEEEEAAKKFNLGELDWIGNLAGMKDIADKSSIHIAPMFSTEYFFFRTDTGISANPKIREALLLAIPYEKLRGGYLIPASTLVFPLNEYPKITGVEEYNIYKAREILDSLNLSSEDKIIKVKIPENEHYNKLLKILTNAWKVLGFEIVSEKHVYAEYFPKLKTPDYNLGVISWIGDFADPMAFLENFRAGSGLNNSAWQNKEYENSIRLAGSEKNLKKRYKYLSEAEQRLIKDSVIIPLSHNPSANIIDIYSFSGWYTNAINIHPFKFIKFKYQKILPGIVMNF